MRKLKDWLSNLDKKQKWLLKVTALIILVMLVCLIVFSCTKSKNEKAINTIGKDIVINGDIPNLTEQELKDLLQKKQDASKFTIQCSSAGTISKGSKELNLVVSNPKNNRIELDNDTKEVRNLDCYFEVVFNGETVYTSPVMKPKSYIEKEELSRTLPTGMNKVSINYVVLFDGVKVGTTMVETIVTCK